MDDATQDMMKEAMQAIRAVLDDYRVIIERATFPVARAALPPVEDYNVIRADLVNRIFDAFIGFLSSAGSVARFRNAARRTLVEDIPAAFYSGYSESAGADAETTPDDERFVTNQVTAQLAFMDAAFESLKDWREAENFTESDVQGRAEVWGRTLDSIYTQGKMLGAKNKMLTWNLGPTEKHCPDCSKLDGKRHSAKWYFDRNYIPGKPGAAMTCKGFECKCELKDDDGNVFTFA